MLGRNKQLELGVGVLVCLLALVPAAAAQSPNCIPSCAEDDGRFLVITEGSGLDTLTDTVLELQIRSSGGGYSLGFFDGETSSAAGHWDLNAKGSIPQLTFNLYADPLGDGLGSTLLASFDGEAMLDNGWSDFAVADDSAARSPSGEYVYLLQAELTGLLNRGLRTNFKVRTDTDVLIEVFQQPFAFAATMPDFKELLIIYPGCVGLPLADCLATLENTTYDGDFRFFLTVSQPQDELVIWDGDLDRGDWDGTNQDGDDPNTPNDFTGLPSWACLDPGQPCTADGGSNPRLASINFEGVAIGDGTSTGNPPDDFDAGRDQGLGSIFLREGPISYEVWGPDARLLATNDDPSGNREWEQFRLAVPGSPAYLDDNLLPPDVDVDELPAGIYEVRVKNLDLENLNAFRFGVPAVTEPNCDDGRPTGLTFIYRGDSCSEAAAANNSQGGLPGTSGDYECTGPLVTGDPREVRLVPVKKPGRFEMVPATAFLGEELTIRAKTKNDRLFPHTELEVQDAVTGEVLQEVTLHTSCSQPLIVGEQFGSLELYAYFLKF